MRKFKRYAEKKLEAKDQHLKEFYSVAASAFNTLEMFRGLSALTAKMIEKERNAYPDK